MRLTVLLALLISGCSTCADPLEGSSEHFQIVADTSTSSEAEMKQLLEDGEAFRMDIAAISPPSTVLDPLIRVELHGNYRSESPYVDEDGTMHLWRFSRAEGGYYALFSHELVHAIDHDYQSARGAFDWKDWGFYGEGWAEYASLLVDPEKSGFPLFGYDEDVVVGHWIKHGGLSLARLRVAHDELNLPCQYQAYPMRASWFRYIDEEMGHEVLTELVAANDGWTPAAVEALLGKSLEDVDAAWRRWALERYANHPNADEEARAFRERISWVEPCVE